MKKLLLIICLVLLVGCSKLNLENGPTHKSLYKIGDKVEFVIDGRIGQITSIRKVYGAYPHYAHEVFTKVKSGGYYIPMWSVDDYKLRKVEDK